jgi:ATP-binding cassette subfamily B protein
VATNLTFAAAATAQLVSGVDLLFSYLRKYRGLILLALVLAATNQVFSLLDPLFFRHVIDDYATRFREYETSLFIKGAG